MGRAYVAALTEEEGRSGASTFDSAVIANRDEGEKNLDSRTILGLGVAELLRHHPHSVPFFFAACLPEDY